MATVLALNRFVKRLLAQRILCASISVFIRNQHHSPRICAVAADARQTCEGDVRDPYGASALVTPPGNMTHYPALAVSADRSRTTRRSRWSPAATGAARFDHRAFTNQFPLSGRGSIDGNGVAPLSAVRTPFG
jgi:hypothetical protein